MIDKTMRKATAERNGPVVVVRYTGGGDCLWLNMYLDCEHGQMTCDSDMHNAIKGVTWKCVPYMPEPPKEE